MTEREFEQLRNSYQNYGGRYENRNSEEGEGGYFAFFKLRCLICLILFLGIVVLDRQIDIRSNDRVRQVVYLLEQEEITAEQCFNIIK